MNRPKISEYGEGVILLQWPASISPELHEEILFLEKILANQFKQEILETVVTYNEMALFLIPGVDSDNIIQVLKNLNNQWQLERPKERIIWKIPVCYAPVFGLDQKIVSAHNGLTIDQIVQLHTAQPYRIYFTGFLPGFLYLGGLPENLATPRKETPRLQIPRGAVGIAGSQTGIYPSQSPGGWQIIGQCPLLLFDKNKQPPSPFLPGDFIQFEAISTSEFETISEMVNNCSYTIQKMVSV